MLDEQPLETTLYSLGERPPGPAQRRSEERHLSLLRVGSLMVDGRRELCLIKNISAGGMLIRAYSKIAEGAKVAIELKQGEPVSGVARWTRDDCVGVNFDQPIDVVALISTSGDGPRPRMPRVEIDCLAWVREDGTVHHARAVNISQGGVKVECRTSIAVGAEVTVTLPGLQPCPGTVRWSDAGDYGVTFNRVLALPVLVSWLQDQRERLRAAG